MDIKFPKISIVTPSYNQAKFLEETIQSVIDQRYPNLEYIIIDGGSSDGSQYIIRKYESYLTYWESQRDSGQSCAINKGFRKATGEIISYLNSDDRYCSNALLSVAKYFLEHPECMWLCGNILFTNERGKIFARKKPIYTPFILRFGSSSIYQPNVFVRRRILSEVGFLREDFHAIMDREWFCRISEVYRPHIIDVDIALFRWHSASKSCAEGKSFHKRRYFEERVLITKRYLPGLNSIIDSFPRFFIFSLEQIARGVKLWKRIVLVFNRIIRRTNDE